MTFNAALRNVLLLSLLAIAPARAADDAILLIDQTAGVAGVQRDGKRLALQPGDALQEQDLIVTDRSGRMSLRLGRHGFVEVGPNAEVGVERLPFATYARDLKSIFSVSKGYFRMVWKHPQLSSTWPLYVYMSGHRISLVSGEYFFQNQGALQQVCVAAGQLALQAAGSDTVETIKPPACVRLAPNAAPQIAARNPDDWIAIRRGFSIEATAITLLAAEPSPALPAAVAPSKPIINTTPAVIATVPPPVAIAAPAAEAAISDDLLATAAEARAAPAANYALPLGPVMAAPVLPSPAAAPPTLMTPALPSYGPPRIANSKPIATAPIFIGQVIAAPSIAIPSAAVKRLPPAVLGAPSPSKSMPVASGGQWALNIASYSESSAAEQQALRLRAAGYAGASTQPATVNGRAWHRVQLGGFANESEARVAALALKTQLGLQNIWVLRP